MGSMVEIETGKPVYVTPSPPPEPTNTYTSRQAVNAGGSKPVGKRGGTATPLEVT